MTDWLKDNVLGVAAFLVSIAGWAMGFGRLLQRQKQDEEEIARLIADMKIMRDQCSGASCANQRNECADRFLPRSEFVEFRSELRQMLGDMDTKREAARSSMMERWNEITEFMGEVRAELRGMRK